MGSSTSPSGSGNRPVWGSEPSAALRGKCPHCKEIVTVRRTLGNIYCTQCNRWIRTEGCDARMV